jgi:hypothetical protein
MKEHRCVFTIWLMDKDIPKEEMMVNMLASHPSSCVTSWQTYDINGYTYYTKEKNRRSVTQNSGIRIEAFDSLGVKTTYSYMTYGNLITAQDCKYMSLSVNGSNTQMV